MRGRFAKIVATLGPASRAPDTMRLLHEAGVDAFRLNFSHGSHEDHAKAVKNIRGVSELTGNAITIIADMQGPKLRVGTFKGDSMELRWNETVELRLTDDESDGSFIPVNHPELFKAVGPDNRLKFDDGKLQVTVIENKGEVIMAKVDVPGLLSNRKGLNVIGAVLPMSAMTDKDRVDMVFALEQNVDFIALSFVQTPQDVKEAREIIGDKAGIIVKIEKPSAVEQLRDILEYADAVMVARGDLGVELPLEEVPIVQRRIIRRARSMGKPVIVATHMLESMIDSPTPTRAETSDVATAIFLGSDAVMLSAETAVGRHPATAVAIMDRIIRAAEADVISLDYRDERRLRHNATANDAISHSVRGIAEILKTSAVFGYTATGSTAQRISRERPPCQIIGLTPYPKTANRLALSWGIHPVVTEDPESFDGMLKSIQGIAQDLGYAQGETILIAAGIPFGRAGATDTLKIAVID